MKNLIIVLKYLIIEYDLDLNDTKSFDYSTPILSMMCVFNHVREIEFMYKMGADLNIKTYHRNKPLYVAIENNNLEVVKFLIKNGCKLKSEIGLAIKNNNYDMFKFLLNYHDPVYKIISNLFQHNRPKMLKYYLDKGGDIKPTDEFTFKTNFNYIFERAYSKDDYRLILIVLKYISEHKELFPYEWRKKTSKDINWRRLGKGKQRFYKVDPEMYDYVKLLI